jgi:hypothetical protein
MLLIVGYAVLASLPIFHTQEVKRERRRTKAKINVFGHYPTPEEERALIQRNKERREAEAASIRARLVEKNK